MSRYTCVDIDIHVNGHKSNFFAVWNPRGDNRPSCVYLVICLEFRKIYMIKVREFTVKVLHKATLEWAKILFEIPENDEIFGFYYSRSRFSNGCYEPVDKT